MLISESEDNEDDDVINDISKSNMFQEMVHVGLRVRQDLQNTPGHSCTWQGINQEHVDRVTLTVCFSVCFLVVKM